MERRMLSAASMDLGTEDERGYGQTETDVPMELKTGGTDVF
jgi:hypothetical protein